VAVSAANTAVVKELTCVLVMAVMLAGFKDDKSEGVIAAI
jgi:hypothetical protein